MQRLWAWGRYRCPDRVEELSAPALAAWLAEGKALQLVDIRGDAAFRAGHLPGALHVPLQRLDQMLSALDPSRPTVVY
jgi:rhodanese-related sulfurtransferase